MHDARGIELAPVYADGAGIERSHIRDPEFFSVQKCGLPLLRGEGLSGCKVPDKTFCHDPVFGISDRQGIKRDAGNRIECAIHRIEKDRPPPLIKPDLARLFADQKTAQRVLMEELNNHIFGNLVDLFCRSPIGAHFDDLSSRCFPDIRLDCLVNPACHLFARNKKIHTGKILILTLYLCIAIKINYYHIYAIVNFKVRSR